MRSVVPATRHLIGLFIDDGGFAAAILLWVIVNVLLPDWIGLAMLWRGPLLFAGLALLLVWTCLRQAARRP
jgi:hypothetical protein